MSTFMEDQRMAAKQRQAEIDTEVSAKKTAIEGLESQLQDTRHQLQVFEAERGHLDELIEHIDRLVLGPKAAKAPAKPKKAASKPRRRRKAPAKKAPAKPKEDAAAKLREQAEQRGRDRAAEEAAQPDPNAKLESARSRAQTPERISLERVRDFVVTLSVPFATGQVAQYFDIPPETARKHLAELAKRGIIRRPPGSPEVGRGARYEYVQPPSNGTPTTRPRGEPAIPRPRPTGRRGARPSHRSAHGSFRKAGPGQAALGAGPHGQAGEAGHMTTRCPHYDGWVEALVA